MRSIVVGLALSWAACGGEHPHAECSVRCIDTCDDGQVCSAGFCAAPDSTCEPSFQTVSAGTGFACALDQLHRAWCWGGNANHEIDGSGDPIEPRAIVAGDRRWDSIAVGGGHACALVSSELWCWGRNDRGQVTGALPGDVSAPVRIEVPGQTVAWSYVSAGVDSTCAIGSGRLFCWGANDAGKLGTGGFLDIARPAAVQSILRDWTRVAVGARHACAVSNGAGLFCWGDGSSGQLGNGALQSAAIPQQVGLAGVTSIALGLDATCAVAAGSLYCWGHARDGMLGDPALVNPDGPDVAAPARASDLIDWTEVAAGERYACARRGTDVWCWGTARAGGIGDGRWQSARGFARVLGDASALSIGWNATAADPGLDEGDYDLTCAVQNGAVACWGDNRSGQLGQGTATRSPLPVELAGDKQWDSIVAGDAHACGIANGTALCWGSSELGQVRGVAMGAGTPCTAAGCDVGVPQPVVDQVSQLVAGGAHTCALQGDVIECWGANRAGQCGTSPSAAARPTAVPGSWDTLLGAGARGTCASTGTETWCWGAALATHEPAHDAALDGARTVALDDNFGCALVAAGGATPSTNDGGLSGPGTGQLVCFGDAIGVFGNGATGTCGDGTCNANETSASCAGDCGAPPLTHLDRTYSAIAIGRRAYTCGVRGDGAVECWGDNLYGQSGQHMGNQLVHPVPLPFAMPGLASCTQITTGAQHVCALCNGALACWGDASHGELGFPVTHDPVTVPRTINVPLVGDRWVEIAAGDGFTCGRTELGHGYCWGTSLHGALGNGATSANLPVIVQH